MILTSSTQSVTAVLAGAATSAAAKCFATFDDIAPTSGNIAGGGNKSTDTNGVTAITVCSAPTSGTGYKRRIKFMSVNNLDTGAITITFKLADSAASTATFATFTLAVGDTLQYTDEGGWKQMSSTGAVKSTQTAGSANQLKQTLIIPIGTLVLIADTNTYRVAVPFAFTVLSARHVVDKPATTSNKLTTLTLSTTGGAVTGGVMALTSANCTPTGNPVAATTISGANATQTAGAEIIITASSTTAFVEGTGHVEVVVSNNS